MKKILIPVIAAAFAAGVFGVSACAQEDATISIVTTIFPEYDWVINILGDNPAGAETTLLLDNGVDLHSYQPTADDILKISTCDLFIYVGGESDRWVEDALGEAVNKDMKVINLLEVLGDHAKEEEIVEGMEAEEHGHEEGPEYDEHVWLSLRNASILTKSICQALQEIDPDHADQYASNEEEYSARIDELDGEYQAVVDAAPVKTLLFGDRFPFRYMTDDYGIDYYAAFTGCSAETEASFETVIFLSQKMEELSLHSIMAIEGSDCRLAETIANNAKSDGLQILILDSMQGTTRKDIENGADYLSIMEKNLEVLKEALK